MRPNKQHEGAESLDEETLYNHPQFASTLANGLAVLGCFHAGDVSLGNKELSERLGMTRPTIARLTFTLVGLGYLRRDPATSRYSLGPAVLTLGYPLLSQLMIRQVAAGEMLKLANYAGGPVSVGALDRTNVVYVETVHSRESNETRPGIGSARPLLRTAMGRAVLYGLPAGEQAKVLARLRHAVPDDYESLMPDVEESFDEIRRKGFCRVRATWRPSLAAVAVPMRHRVNGLTLAFNLTLPAYAVTDMKLEEDFGPRLVGLVHQIEQLLGVA